jgi:UDP-N-acetylmuramoylalanine--D-glutamate ligase
MGTLVYGLAVAGRAVAEYLAARGDDVTLADDAPTDEHRDFARAIGAPLLEGAALTTAVQDVAGYARLVPSPGVPESHPIVRAALAAGVDVVSEIELGYRDETGRVGGPRPFVAITGTDGKTTTTLMAAAMLCSAGHRARAVGNTELPPRLHPRLPRLCIGVAEPRPRPPRLARRHRLVPSREGTHLGRGEERRRRGRSRARCSHRRVGAQQQCTRRHVRSRRR